MLLITWIHRWFNSTTRVVLFICVGLVLDLDLGLELEVIQCMYDLDVDVRND